MVYEHCLYAGGERCRLWEQLCKLQVKQAGNGTILESNTCLEEFATQLPTSQSVFQPISEMKVPFSFEHQIVFVVSHNPSYGFQSSTSLKRS